jgi:LysR family hydrogen peroxide-inducible transcriptional activator
MDLRQLQSLLAVVDHGGFTAAARATHTVQSNISAHVARLEKELDAVLIDRASGAPTAEGDAVVARARRIENELTALEADVSSLRGSPRGTVRIGVIGTTGRWLTPLLVDRAAETTPDLRLLIADGSTTSLVLRLLEGELDLALVSLRSADPDLIHRPLFEETNELIAPDDHPLVGLHRQPTLADVAEHELLLAAPGTAFRVQIDEVFAAAGLEVRPKVEIDGLRLLASLAFQGFGATILPATAAPSWITGPWRRLPMPGLGRRTVGLATRKRGLPSAAAEATASLISDVITSHASPTVGIHPITAPR